MDEQFKDFADAPAPVLTFGEPVPEKKEVPAVEKQPEKPAEPQLSEDLLTDDERKMVDDFSKISTSMTPTGSFSMGWGPRKRWLIFQKMH